MIFAPARTTRNLLSGSASAWLYAGLLGLGYLLFYGWLLARSGGFPYVLDNNESFSSLWHAINLDRFGFASGYGLTDEAYGPSAAAHPYVYTHQGNFPRLVAYLFYVLGAHSIEAQILVTTFTVGLASLFFAYRFLGQLTANWPFAALACAVVFTDYVLVAQWQVVTYRVWHAFFFFSTLLCIHAIEGERPLRASALLLLNTACLFYFEFVFAAFMAAFAGLYALFRNARRFRRVMLVGVTLAVGAAIGVGVLCLQIVLYMGWDNFVKDATYTFVSRNQFADSETMMATLRTFYESNRIVFWYNLFDASSFRTLQHLVASVLYYELQPHTPYFILLLLFPAIGALLPMGGALLLASQHRAMAGDFSNVPMAMISRALVIVTRYIYIAIAPVLPATLVGSHLLHRASRGEFGLIQFCGLAVGLLGAGIAIARFRKGKAGIRATASLASVALLLGAAPSAIQYIQWVRGQVGYITTPLLIFFAIWALLLVINVHLASLRDPGSPGAPSASERSFSVRRVFDVTAFLASSLILALILFGSGIGLGWLPIGGLLWGIVNANLAFCVLLVAIAYVGINRASALPISGPHVWLLPGNAGLELMNRFWRYNALAIVVLLAHSLLYNQAYQPIWQALVNEVLPEPALRVLMLLSILLAYTLLHTGTSSRRSGWSGTLLSVPRLGVYLLAGYLAYLVVYMLTPGYVFTGYRFRLTPFTVFLTDVVLACGIYIVFQGGLALAARLRWHHGWGLLVGAVPLFFWFQLQFAQVSLMPPDHLSVLKTLASPPYKGASFVSNTYAAPVAAFTGQWAYIDQELAQANVEMRDGVLRLKTDDRYIWLADRETNPEYRKPQYFICLIPQSLPSLAAKLRQERGEGPGYRGCADMGLVKFARSGRTDVVPRAELVAIDVEGKARFGHETWAIVKLDWGS